MPSPKEVKYPDGNDCSKCIHCEKVELGKVFCGKYGTIDPDLTCGFPSWPITVEECPLYKIRKEFMEVRE